MASKQADRTLCVPLTNINDSSLARDEWSRGLSLGLIATLENLWSPMNVSVGQVTPVHPTPQTFLKS